MLEFLIGTHCYARVNFVDPAGTHRYARVLNKQGTHAERKPPWSSPVWAVLALQTLFDHTDSSVISNSVNHPIRESTWIRSCYRSRSLQGETLLRISCQIKRYVRGRSRRKIEITQRPCNENVYRTALALAMATQKYDCFKRMLSCKTNGKEFLEQAQHYCMTMLALQIGSDRFIQVSKLSSTLTYQSMAVEVVLSWSA